MRVPDHFALLEGATLTTAGLTAWAAVVTHGKTRHGDWVLVHGTGGVSVFALQNFRSKFLKLRAAVVWMLSSRLQVDAH